MRWFVESPPQQGDQKLQGADYCRNLESNARMNALRHDALGYVLAALGAGSAGTGVVLLATEPDDHVGKNRKALDLGLPILGAVLYAFAAGEFSRAKDANDLASTAAAAETSDKDDIKKNDLCLTAHAAWDNSRSASSAIVEKLTQATKPTDAEVKAKEEKARAEADEAKAKAKKAEAEQQKAEAEAAKAKR